MKVKMILPALKEAIDPDFRPIKYSLFPPLGLAQLAAWFPHSDEVEIVDEHVERSSIEDSPDLVVIQAYVTSARRSYQIADSYRKRGIHVCIGGLHPTSLPEEAALHADTVFTGPSEDSWPRFLDDFRDGKPAPRYDSRQRTLDGVPPPRYDLLKRRLYLCPNTLVVSRGCPFHCDFCYKDSFFGEGDSFYTLRVDEALARISALPGRHLFFLDDNIFADPVFSAGLFEGMKGMNRLWQGAGTVGTVLANPELVAKAAESGLKSLFIGFETLKPENLASVNKGHNLRVDYAKAVSVLHSHGIMINASFVFGFDGDDPGVFDRTVRWAIENGIETATFHILTPYPATRLHRKLRAEKRIISEDWDLYDTRHAVFRPALMSPEELEKGYRKAYSDFYEWGSIFRSARTKQGIFEKIRHIAYCGAWKKSEPFWSQVIRSGRLHDLIPYLERVLKGSPGL